MKAIVYEKHGSPDVLGIEEIEKPVPGESEVLIRVRAASVNPADWRLAKTAPYMRRIFFRMSKAKVIRPGIDVAGEVETVGRNATQFKPGDEVFGGCHGAFAEYACTPESKLVIKPRNVTFEQVASVAVAALSALQGLRKGKMQPGQKVLINGAAGGVGTFAVQIAKALGAEITGVCSTRNVDMVRSIGADHVIDYAQNDFTKSGERYDLILECVGNPPLAGCRRVLNPKGICVMVGAPKQLGRILSRMIAAPVLSWFGPQKFVMFIAKMCKEDLITLRDLMEIGKVTPVIDRRYALNEVPEAMRYLEEGHARGKVVIILDSFR